MIGVVQCQQKKPLARLGLAASYRLINISKVSNKSLILRYNLRIGSFTGRFGDMLAPFVGIARPLRVWAFDSILPNLTLSITLFSHFVYDIMPQIHNLERIRNGLAFCGHTWVVYGFICSGAVCANPQF